MGRDGLPVTAGSFEVRKKGPSKEPLVYYSTKSLATLNIDANVLMTRNKEDKQAFTISDT